MSFMPPRQPRNLRNTGLFGLAYLFSVFGSESIFFVMMLHVYHLTENAVNTGIFAVLTIAPKFAAPFLGLITDRFRKERLFGLMNLSAALLILLLSRAESLKAIYGIWLVLSIAFTFSANIRAVLMAEILPPRNYARGNSATLVAANAAKVLAPLLGGLAATVIKTPVLLGLTAAMYLLAAICCRLMKGHAGPAGLAAEGARTPAAPREIWKQLREGFSDLYHDRVLRFLVAAGLCWRLFLGLQTSLFIVYVRGLLARSDADYGLFLTVLGCGSMLGSLIGPRVRAWAAGPARPGKPRGPITFLFWGLGIHFITFALLGVIGDFHWALLTVFLSFTAFYTCVVSLHTLRDQGTKPEMRGKVYGSVTALLTLPAVISMLAGGLLAGWLGVGTVLLGSGLAALGGLWLITGIMNPFPPARRKEHAEAQSSGSSAALPR